MKPRALQTLVLLCLLPMTAGCKLLGDPSPPPVALKPAPVVVDLAAVRCGELTAADRAIWSRTTPRPQPTVGADGRSGVTKLQTQRWISALEQSERDKNASGVRVVATYDQCKGSGPTAGS